MSRLVLAAVFIATWLGSAVGTAVLIACIIRRADEEQSQHH